MSNIPVYTLILSTIPDFSVAKLSRIVLRSKRTSETLGAYFLFGHREGLSLCIPAAALNESVTWLLMDAERRGRLARERAGNRSYAVSGGSETPLTWQPSGATRVPHAMGGPTNPCHESLR